MDRLVIACMDRRLNKYLDSLNDGRTIFLRNAGGNVGSLASSIRYILNNHGIRRIHVVTHTDCGAMKVVAGARDKSMKVSDTVQEGLVRYFNRVEFGNRGELEKANEALQQEAIAKLAGGGFEITTELFDISKAGQHGGQGDHVLAITRASDWKYEKIAGASRSDLAEMYTVQADNIDEVMHDIEIAVGTIGIHDVRVVALEASEYRPLRLDSNKLKAKPFSSGVHIDYIKA